MPMPVAVAGLAVQDGLHLFGGHAHAVVPHAEQDVPAVRADLHLDLAFVHHQVQAVVDRVFQDGLQRDLVAQAVQAGGVDRKGVGKAVFCSGISGFCR